MAKAIADHNCFSIVGGGDTLPIIENLKLQNGYNCLSTGGGSLLTYLEGGSLPIIDKAKLEIMKKDKNNSNIRPRIYFSQQNREDAPGWSRCV